MIPRASLRPDVFGNVTRLPGSHQNTHTNDPVANPTARYDESDTLSHPDFRDVYNQHYAPIPPYIEPHNYYYHPHRQHVLTVPTYHYHEPYGYMNTFTYDPIPNHVYPISPGNKFEHLPHDSKVAAPQRQTDHFEIESVTADGVPYHVRNVSNGERFVVDAPVLRTNEGSEREVLRESRDELTGAVHTDNPVRRTLSNPMGESSDNYTGGRFHHQDPEDSATSSYTDVSIRTISGPHFLNDINYLDNATRSRVVQWLNTSTDIRLRRVADGENIDTSDGPPSYRESLQDRR